MGHFQSLWSPCPGKVGRGPDRKLTRVTTLIPQQTLQSASSEKELLLCQRWQLKVPTPLCPPPSLCRTGGGGEWPSPPRGALPIPRPAGPDHPPPDMVESPPGFPAVGEAWGPFRSLHRLWGGGGSESINKGLRPVCPYKAGLEGLPLPPAGSPCDCSSPRPLGPSLGGYRSSSVFPFLPLPAQLWGHHPWGKS